MINIIVSVETFVAFIIAITIHEASHAGMAALLGDSTPSSDGRLSLSPRRQMAIIGTIVAIVYSLSASLPIGLGWGKPVDLDARRMRVNPNVGMILVAIAGPLVNLGIGLGLAALLQVAPGYQSLGHALTTPINCLGQGGGQALQACLAQNSAQPIYLLRIEQFVFAFAVTNIVLALLNIIPLHPLDGYQVLYALLPTTQAVGLRKFEPYMELILLVIFFVVPRVFALLGADVNPGGALAYYANDIGRHFAPYVQAFYAAL